MMKNIFLKVLLSVFLIFGIQNFTNAISDINYDIEGFGTEPFWTIGIKQDTLYYSSPEGNSSHKVEFYKHSGVLGNLGFSGENISGDIEEKSCVDDSKGDTHKYTINFTLEEDMVFKGCADGDISKLNFFEIKPIGGDIDAHGCMIGAGYRWYPIKQDCIRIFEVNLDKQKYYDRYLKLLDKAGGKGQKKVFDIMQKYEKITKKYSSIKKVKINEMIVKKIDEILKKKNNTILELLKFEIMQLD